MLSVCSPYDNHLVRSHSSRINGLSLSLVRTSAPRPPTTSFPCLFFYTPCLTTNKPALPLCACCSLCALCRRTNRICHLVSGAGIVGLTLAIALNALDKEHKIAIDLYEAAPELSEIGAGINVWPRTLAIFKQIGLADILTPFFDHYPDLEPSTSSVLVFSSLVISVPDGSSHIGIIFGVRKGDQKNGFKIYDAMNNGKNTSHFCTSLTHQQMVCRRSSPNSPRRSSKESHQASASAGLSRSGDQLSMHSPSLPSPRGLCTDYTFCFYQAFGPNHPSLC